MILSKQSIRQVAALCQNLFRKVVVAVLNIPLVHFEESRQCLVGVSTFQEAMSLAHSMSGSDARNIGCHWAVK